eukprot:1952535-Rhodomonas_salina.1
MLDMTSQDQVSSTVRSGYQRSGNDMYAMLLPGHGGSLSDVEEAPRAGHSLRYQTFIVLLVRSAVYVAHTATLRQPSHGAIHQLTHRIGGFMRRRGGTPLRALNLLSGLRY